MLTVGHDVRTRGSPHGSPHGPDFLFEYDMYKQPVRIGLDLLLTIITLSLGRKGREGGV